MTDWWKCHAVCVGQVRRAFGTLQNMCGRDQLEEPRHTLGNNTKMNLKQLDNR
jgi:hypothetical protein